MGFLDAFKAKPKPKMLTEEQKQARKKKKAEQEKLMMHLLESLGEIKEQNKQMLFRLDGIERIAKESHFNDEKIQVEMTKIHESSNHFYDSIMNQFETFMNDSDYSRSEKPKKSDYNSMKIQLPDRSKEIFEYLVKKKGKMCELTTIANELGFAKNDASARLSDMADRGFVRRKRAGRKALYGVY